MKIKSVEFHKSVDIESEKVFFENREEYIFVGRSNVGKSSLMNSIFGKKDLVKTSRVPGKTRTANVFLVNNKIYFTDLPGYGYAKMSKEQRAKLDALISWYIEEKRENIQKVILLIDSKIGPTDDDIDMFKYLMELAIPMIIVLNKVDKVKKQELEKTKKKIKELFFGQTITTYSSKTQKQKKEFLNLLDS